MQGPEIPRSPRDTDRFLHKREGNGKLEVQQDIGTGARRIIHWDSGGSFEENILTLDRNLNGPITLLTIVFSNMQVILFYLKLFWISKLSPSPAVRLQNWPPSRYFKGSDYYGRAIGQINENSLPKPREPRAHQRLALE